MIDINSPTILTDMLSGKLPLEETLREVFDNYRIQPTTIEYTFKLIEWMIREFGVENVSPHLVKYAKEERSFRDRLKVRFMKPVIDHKDAPVYLACSLYPPAEGD